MGGLPEFSGLLKKKVKMNCQGRFRQTSCKPVSHNP